MAYKQPSGGPFKMMGSSPVKQGKKYTQKPGGMILNEMKEAEHAIKRAEIKKAKNFNAKGGKSTTPGYKTTKSAKAAAKTTLPKNFNTTGTSKAGKLAKVAKKPASILGRTTKVFKNTAKQFAKKAGKLVGGKALGVAGMMMATSAKADQPTKKQGKKGSYTGDFTKLK